MRVIAGECRSMPLYTPKGDGTRPTTDRIKETLFNILQADVPGAVFCDFFAGSGGIGIEALSRGARHAYFVENGKEALECIKKNLNFTKLADKATVISRDVRDSLYSIDNEVDIIFMDPPYELGIEGDVMQLLASSRCVTEDTIIIIEADIHNDLSYIEDMGYELTREKCYKTNKHCFFRLK